MNLLGAKLYDPSTAVTNKATSSLLAMTAFDTTNLRLTVTVPAHGMVRFRIRCGVFGATTCPRLLLGVLNGASVVGRVTPAYENATANATTQGFLLDAEFTATGLTPGSTSFDAAYGVEVVVASTNIKYGGPNNTTTDDAWGAFQFEAWDPQPLTLALDGAVNVKQWNGTNVSTPATAGIPDVNVKNINNVSASPVTTIKAVQGLATDGVVPTVTTLTNLPAITSNWLTAAGIAASALNGKGDWNVGKTGYALTTPPLDAAATRSAVGLASANLDTQLSTIDDFLDTEIAAIKAKTDNLPSDPADASDIAAAFTTVNNNISTVAGYIDTEVAAIKAKTDNLPASPAAASDCITAAGVRSAVGLASANLDTQLDALPTNAELSTALAGADDATLAAIAALNNVSTAQVQTAAAAALTAYDPPTRTEATADKDEVLTAVGDVPTNAELATALAGADDVVLAQVALVKAKTDQLTFTNAGEVDANTHSINDVTVGGTGVDGDEWGPA